MINLKQFQWLDMEKIKNNHTTYVEEQSKEIQRIFEERWANSFFGPTHPKVESERERFAFLLGVQITFFLLFVYDDLRDELFARCIGSYDKTR